MHQQWLDIRSADRTISDQPQISVPNILTLPGETDLGPNWRLDSHLHTWSRSDSAPWRVETASAVVWLPEDVPQPLLVRSRQPGDRMSPLGLGGSKDINVLMTDLKLPRAARPQWPLLIDAEGEILWLVGRRGSEACRLSDAATIAWEIRLVASS
jgi:tRNA(Ile)-lysidine synthetase-like protein